MSKKYGSASGAVDRVLASQLDGSEFKSWLRIIFLFRYGNSLGELSHQQCPSFVVCRQKIVLSDIFIGVGRFRILGGARFGIFGGWGGKGGGAKFPAGT